MLHTYLISAAHLQLWELGKGTMAYLGWGLLTYYIFSFLHSLEMRSVFDVDIGERARQPCVVAVLLEHGCGKEEQ